MVGRKKRAGMSDDGLRWSEEKGIGFYPVVPGDQYNVDYWNKYRGYAKTDLGVLLSRKRVDLVDKYADGKTTVDVGIGCGQFIEMRGGRTYGYDVNPVAIQWLLDRGLWWDPYFKDPDVACFWDSLEHVERPDQLVSRIRHAVVVSLPIFEGRAHILRSKHFRKDEHFWYFTEAGFIRWMNGLDFELAEKNRMEVECGREDIGTFVFVRNR
jgi:hypothetical protein